MARMGVTLRALPRAVRWYGAAVALNYAAQVPYNLDLYGGSFSLRGAALLGATLLWFLAGVGLLAAGRRAGWWLLVAYAGVQTVFYLNGEVLLAFAGYGLPYHLLHARDAIVWLTFAAGLVNAVAAVAFLAWAALARPLGRRARAGG